MNDSRPANANGGHEGALVAEVHETGAMAGEIARWICHRHPELAADVNSLITNGTFKGSRACVSCGCTDVNACVGPDDTACCWVTDDLCSACATAEVIVPPAPWTGAAVAFRDEILEDIEGYGKSLEGAVHQPSEEEI